MLGKRSFFATGLVAVLVGLGVAAASPAMAEGPPPTCQKWHDKSTYGYSCTPSASKYQATAQCSNGEWYRGPLVSSGWSYVYCSTVGAEYVEGTGGYAGTGGG